MSKKNIKKSNIKMDWDLTSYFPEFNCKEMTEFKTGLENDIISLTKKAAKFPSLSAKTFSQWESLIIKCEKLLDKMSHLASYLGCLCSVDAANEEYQIEYARMSELDSKFEILHVEILRALKDAPEKTFREFVKRKNLKDIIYYMGRQYKHAKHTMSKENEMLNAELSVNGISAWGRLYDTISGKLEFEMVYPDGKREILPISQRRSLLDDANRDIRKAAFIGGNEAWAKYEDVAAAALNAIAGTRHVLNKHRGIKHFLDVALEQAGVENKTIETMFDVIKRNVSVPNEILKYKAKSQKTKAVAWYDLGAELDIPDQERIPWDKAKALVLKAFYNGYPALGDFLQECFDKKWIEYDARPGKRPGAFCTGSLLTRESRVFMTYKGSIGDILTLAHEVGHAFHSRILKDVRSFSHLYPMTLAETASTFGENLLIDGVLEDPEISDSQKALILDIQVSHGVIYLLDIFVRFEFEKKFYEERKNGELGISRFKELIVQTQREIFGNLLEKDGEDPYFWVSKLHFYIPEVEFYNFPYTFGYLLSRGLYAMFKKEGANFLPKYEKFLSLTGDDTAENVAKRSIEVDLKKPAFWEQSVKSLEEPLARLKKLLPKVMKK